MARSTPSLHPQTTWLFAIGALAVGLGVGWLTRHMSPKITGGLYAAIVGLAGFGSTFLTRAKVRHAILPFIVAGLAAAAIYYLIVASVMREALVVTTDAASLGTQHAEGVKVGGMFGNFFGVFAAVVGLLETLVAGIGGAIAGAKFKAQQDASTGGLARAA